MFSMRAADLNIPIIVLRLAWHFVSFVDLSRLWPPFRAVSSLRRVPASPATAGVADPPAQRRSACARPWCGDLRRYLWKILACERFGAFATDRAFVFIRDFFFGTCFLTSDPWGGSATRPASPLWTPAREAACSDLRENWNAPKDTYHSGFVENCHLS